MRALSLCSAHRAETVGAVFLSCWWWDGDVKFSMDYKVQVWASLQRANHPHCIFSSSRKPPQAVTQKNSYTLYNFFLLPLCDTVIWNFGFSGRCCDTELPFSPIVPRREKRRDSYLVLWQSNCNLFKRLLLRAFPHGVALNVVPELTPYFAGDLLFKIWMC